MTERVKVAIPSSVKTETDKETKKTKTTTILSIIAILSVVNIAVSLYSQSSTSKEMSSIFSKISALISMKNPLSLPPSWIAALERWFGKSPATVPVTQPNTKPIPITEPHQSPAINEKRELQVEGFDCGKPVRPINPSTDLFTCGIDTIERLQPEDWQFLYQKGFRFAFFFAGRGMENKETSNHMKNVFSDFEANWQSAKEANLLRGAYFVFSLGDDVEKQVNAFIQNLNNDFGELPVVLDLETSPLKNAYKQNENSSTDKATCQNITDKIFLWISTFKKEAVKRGFKDDVTIYLRQESWELYLSCGKDNVFLENSVWFIADKITLKKQNKLPIKTSPWKNWDFWQYHDQVQNFQLKKTNATVDFSFYNGSLQELKSAFVENK